MYTLKTNAGNPYSPLIETFISKDFTRRLAATNPNLVEVITDEILGTKQTRYGPKLGPESLVAIRDVIRKYVAKNEPIPFMIPWGSEKPDGSGIDIAELAALKTLSCFNARLKAHYEPGIRANIRIEDVSAPYLFHESPDKARENAMHYTHEFVTLVHVLGFAGFIHPVPESTLTGEKQFNLIADDLLPHFEKALRMYDGHEDPKAAEVLHAIGWKGGIDPATRDHYLESYAKLYPAHSHSAKLHILARYFASALARHKLKIRGDEKSWEGSFVDLSFMPPVQGTDGLFGRRVYYRTLPLEFTSNHIAPWRAKGYLQIGNDNTVTPKLASHQERKPYNENFITFEEGTLASTVRADYVIT